MNSRQLLICIFSIVIGVSSFKPAAGQSSIGLSYGMGAITGDQSAGINGFSFTFRNEISKKVNFGLRADRFSKAEQVEIKNVVGPYTSLYQYDITKIIGIIHANLSYQLLNIPIFRLSGGFGVGGSFSSISSKLKRTFVDQSPTFIGGKKVNRGFFSISPSLDFEVLPFHNKNFGFCGSAYYCKGLTNGLGNYQSGPIDSPFPTDFYSVSAGLIVKF